MSIWVFFAVVAVLVTKTMWNKYYYRSTEYEIEVEDPTWTTAEPFATAICFIDVYPDILAL